MFVRFWDPLLWSFEGFYYRVVSLGVLCCWCFVGWCFVGWWLGFVLFMVLVCGMFVGVLVGFYFAGFVVWLFCFGFDCWCGLGVSV